MLASMISSMLFLTDPLFSRGDIDIGFSFAFAFAFGMGSIDDAAVS